MPIFVRGQYIYIYIYIYIYHFASVVRDGAITGTEGSCRPSFIYNELVKIAAIFTFQSLYRTKGRSRPEQLLPLVGSRAITAKNFRQTIFKIVTSEVQSISQKNENSCFLSLGKLMHTVF